MQSFVEGTYESEFPLEHLPWGVFATQAEPRKRVGVALGDYVVDVAALQQIGLISGPHMSGAGASTCMSEVRHASSAGAVRRAPELNLVPIS